MDRLKDKIAFISGASSGIGQACAHAFAQQGVRLILCARRHQRLDTLAESLNSQYNTTVHTLTLDVTQSNEVSTQLQQLPDQWKNIDILLNNAGLAAGLDPLHEGEIDDWERMIDTNVKGLLYVTKALTGDG